MDYAPLTSDADSAGRCGTSSSRSTPSTPTKTIVGTVRLASETSFKPILYTAAIDRGFTPTSILLDEPVEYQVGNGQVYSPSNYDRKFEGAVTLRRALEDSRNIPAIKVMDTIGPKNVLGYAKRFGF